MSHEFAGLGWVSTTTELTPGEINKLVAASSFPPPTPNVEPGLLLWSKAEVLAWLDHQGVRRTLRI